MKRKTAIFLLLTVLLIALTVMAFSACSLFGSSNDPEPSQTPTEEVGKEDPSTETPGKEQETPSVTPGENGNQGTVTPGGDNNQGAGGDNSQGSGGDNNQGAGGDEGNQNSDENGEGGQSGGDENQTPDGNENQTEGGNENQTPEGNENQNPGGEDNQTPEENGEEDPPTGGDDTPSTGGGSDQPTGGDENPSTGGEENQGTGDPQSAGGDVDAPTGGEQNTGTETPGGGGSQGSDTPSGEGDENPPAEQTDPSQYSVGLAFELLDDGTYEVTGIGNCTDVDLLIPPTYENKAVTSINEAAFQYNRTIASVTIPEGVTTIKRLAFSECAALKEIVLPSTVSKIEEKAFGKSNKLTKISFSKKNAAYHVTENALIETESKVLIAGWGACAIPSDGSVTKVAADACKALTNLMAIVIPDSVEEIGDGAFASCTGAKSLRIGSGVTKIGAGAFAETTSLAAIEVSERNPVYVGVGNCVVEARNKRLVVGCKTSVIPSDGTVTIIGKNAFKSCSGLTAVSIPAQVTKIESNAFGYCFYLKEIVFDAETAISEIATNAFAACSAVRQVYYGGTAEAKASVRIDGGNSALSTATWYYYSESDPAENDNYWHYVAGEPAIWPHYSRGLAYEMLEDGTYEVTGIGSCTDTALVIPSRYNERAVTSIGEEAFAECETITSVEIADSVTIVKKGAFLGCPHLQSAVIGRGATSIGEGIFAYCEELSSIVVREGNSVYYSERNCLIVRESKELIAGCRGSVIPSDVTSIGEYAFNGCVGLTSVTIPSAVTEIKEDAFGGCESLSEVVIRAKLTSIERSVFSGCKALRSISIPGTVTSIGETAFQCCSSLETVTIPEGVQSIGNSAFNECEALASVTLPASLSSIGEQAFWNDYKLTTVRYEGTLADWCGIEGLIYVMGYNVMPVSAKEKKVLYVGDEKVEGLLTIPEGVTELKCGAFCYCFDITAVVIPKSMTKICNYAFYDYPLPISVYYKGTAEDRETIDMTPSSLASDWYYYSETKPTVAGNYWHYGEDGAIAVWEAVITPDDPGENPGGETQQKELAFELKDDDTYEVTGIGTYEGTELVIPATYNGKAVTSIGEEAFYGCGDLTKITVPASVTSIGSYALFCIDGDTLRSVFVSVTVEEGNVSYKSVDGVLYSKDGATLIQYPSAKQGAFTIPTGVTTVERFAFGGCVGLSEVTIPASVMSMEYGAFSSVGLTAVYYGGTAEQAEAMSVGESNGSLTAATWYYYSETQPTAEGNYWHYGEDGANVAVIGTDAFSYCTNLSSVTFASGSRLTTVGDGAFCGCESIVSISLPEGVQTIECCAFSECTSLETILLPASVESIAEGAFDRCDALRAVYYGGTAAEKDAIEINATDNAPLGSAKWYFYSESKPTTEGDYWHYAEGVPSVWQVMLAPVLEMGESGISWASVVGATYYLVSTDGVNWSENNTRSVAFSENVGDHTLRVKGTNGSMQGEVASYSYQTVAVSLGQINRSGLSANWSAAAKSVSLTVNGLGADCAYDEGSKRYAYTCASEAGTYDLVVSALGGFDAAAKIYYAGTDEKNYTITVTKLAAPALTVSNYQVRWGAVTNATGYDIRVDNGDWIKNSNAKSVLLSTTVGEHTVEVKAISGDPIYTESDVAEYVYTTRAVAVSDLTQNGRRVNWTATAYDGALTLYKGDVSQGTAASAADISHTAGGYSYSGIPQTIGSYAIRVVAAKAYDTSNKTYYYTASSVEKSLTVSVTKLSAPTVTKGASGLTWNAISGADRYVSNANESISATSKAYTASKGTQTFAVKAIASADSAYVDSDYSSSVSYYATPVTLNGVTFGGTRATWVAVAKTVQVKEGSGSYTPTTLNYYDLTSLSAGSHSVSVQAIGGYDSATGIYYYGSTVTKSANKTITRASVNLTFEDQTTNTPYTGSGWSQSVLSSESWQTASGNKMNSRPANDGSSRVVNLSAGATTYRFTYSGSGSSLGLANAFSVDIGHYYNDGTIYYKIMLIDTADRIHLISGSTNSYVTLTREGTNENGNRTFHTINYIGFDPIEVKGICFEVKGTQEIYLYIDNLRLTYEDISASAVASYGGDGSKTKGTKLTVSAGGWQTKNLTAGYANNVTFTLKNVSSSATTYVDLFLYDGDYSVATGRYVLYAGQKQGYTLIFNKCKVTHFTIAAASAAGIELTNMAFSENADYEVADHSTYRVPDANSGSVSIRLMGANEVKSSTTISFLSTAIRQLQKYSEDVTPLISYISDVRAIFSATYEQSIDIVTNGKSEETYGTLTIKYLAKGSDTLVTSTITVKRQDNARINNNDNGQSTREYYARNLYKETSIDPHEVILAGSSSMEKWKSFSQDMKGIQVADVGIGGTASTDWTADAGLAESLIYAYNPRAVILFVGVNDLKYNSPVNTTLSNVQTLLSQVHTNLPNATVYYVLINKVPLSKSGSNQLTDENVESFNKGMTQYAASLPWLHLISLDTSNRMVYNGGNAGDLTSFADSMHLNKAGYTEWAYVVRSKFLSID